MEIAELRGNIAAPAAQQAFDRLVEGLSALGDASVHVHEKGFQSALRVERGEDWCLAVVPGEDFVTAYIRKPELRRGVLSPEAVQAIFPEARVSKAGEVIVRLADAEAAARWLTLLRSDTGAAA